MKRVIDFLQRLSENNNRPWFNEHKAEYLEAKAVFDAFAARLIEGIRRFDDSIPELSVADCTYRIYRDTRFSSDKSPYKIHMGAFICPGGKKSDFSGYYFQVGPHDRGYDGGVMLATGNYYCEPKVLKLLREDIAFDDGATFENAVGEARGFYLDYEGALKRVPRGFDADKPYSDRLRLRNFCLVKEPGVGYALDTHLLENVLADFRTTAPFLHFINRAVAYAKEESGL